MAQRAYIIIYTERRESYRTTIIIILEKLNNYLGKCMDIIYLVIPTSQEVNNTVRCS